ncbi:uncharacterized protein [Branchiostoma lanceolatum]|uniref:uncharacterized protein n=1 Tax=Branchiostoma lanceolatum TaxID=7740 RepID=UPI003453827B
MVLKGAVVPVEPCEGQFISSIFLVPKSSGGMRPVINLKRLNTFVQKEHCKFESLELVKELWRQGDYMVTLDLKDAYFTIPIWLQDRKFLRFSWRNQLWEFQCLPFGLTTAPRVFTKVLRPVVAILRKQGLLIVIYLDDLIILARSPEQCLAHIAVARDLLETLGFVLNLEKSRLVPSQVVTFLGFILDSQSMTLSLPEAKVVKVEEECQHCLSLRTMSARHLASVIGLLESTRQAIMQAPLHYRALQTLLNQALEREGSFDSITSLSPPAKDDLQWWVNHVRGVNGRRVFVPTDLTIFSDASLQGWGACCNGQRTGGRWSQLEAGNHINWLELQAAFLALKSFASKQDHHVLLKLDNTTAVAYINRMGGTKSPTLAALALEIWHWALQKGLMLSASHLPGLDITEADSCSRVFQDKTEWQLDRSVFLQINAQTDFSLTIDLFASRLNAQLPRFVAWRPDPMAVAVNALDMDWYQLGLAYAFPPFSLVFRVLRKVQTDHATVMLVAPVWRAQAWYPKLLHMLYDRPTLLPHRRDLLFLPHNKEHHPLFPRLKLAVWPVSGDSCKVEAFLQELQSSSCQPGERVPLDSINHLGDDGVAGVIAGVSIPFQGL